MNAVNKSLANEARTTFLAREDFALKAKIFTNNETKKSEVI